MNGQHDFVVIKKGDEEFHFYGDTLKQMVAGGKLNSALFREPKKPNYILVASLSIIFIIGLCLTCQDYQIFSFLFGSVISTALAVHMYIIYGKKFVFLGIVFIGILISLTASNLVESSSLMQILKSLVKSL